MKNLRPETPPLTRVGRRDADAKLEAAKFRPTVDGRRMVRRFEVHGIEVIEWVSMEKAADGTRLGK
jgi:hypothetical protein